MLKPIYFIAVALLLSLIMQSVHAIDMNKEEECQLIPHATFSAPLTTTVVGLYADATTGPNAKIFWAFYDGSGAQRDSGNFPVTPNNITGFVWSSAAMSSLQGVDGFLLVCLDSNNDTQITEAGDGNHLSASAFFVDTSSSDVAFIPVVHSTASNLNQASPAMWNTGMPLTALSIRDDLDSGDIATFQYAINAMPNNGDDTEIVIWSSSNNLGASQTMTIYTSTGTNNGITVLTPNPYLNIIDLETVPGINASFTGGFVRWTIPGAFTGEAFVYAVIKSPAFGAVQTLLGITSQ